LARLSSPSRGQPIWAGPVRIEPPADIEATPEHPSRTPVTEFEDPPVILGIRRGRGWSLPW
jgi:hypothetical protein